LYEAKLREDRVRKEQNELKIERDDLKGATERLTKALDEAKLREDRFRKEQNELKIERDDLKGATERLTKELYEAKLREDRVRKEQNELKIERDELRKPRGEIMAADKRDSDEVKQIRGLVQMSSREDIEIPTLTLVERTFAQVSDRVRALVDRLGGYQAKMSGSVDAITEAFGRLKSECDNRISRMYVSIDMIRAKVADFRQRPVGSDELGESATSLEAKVIELEKRIRSLEGIRATLAKELENGKREWRLLSGAKARAEQERDSIKTMLISQMHRLREANERRFARIQKLHVDELRTLVETYEDRE
jgi:chromosome segregation ATPase